MLVDTRSSIPVFVTDTTVLYDSGFHPIGKLYPLGVVYLERPFVVDSGRILIRIYSWIYYEYIFNIGNEWLLIQDENIRMKNNCLKIGRIAKNTRLHRIYSPDNWEWNFVSLDCFVEIRRLQSYLDSRYQPIFAHRWPYVVTTDLTTAGSEYPSRHLNLDIKIPEFFTMFPFVIMIIGLWFYFRKTDRLYCRDRWVLLVIDIAGFAAGVALQMII